MCIWNLSFTRFSSKLVPWQVELEKLYIYLKEIDNQNITKYGYLGSLGLKPRSDLNGKAAHLVQINNPLHETVNIMQTS